MSRSRRGGALALATAMALAAGPADFAGAAGAPTTAEVSELTLPIIDLELETTSLDGGFRRVEGRRDVRLTLSADVLFAFDSARLSPRARSRLAAAAREIRALHPDAVSIIGHTDSKGSPGYNLGLSRRRAASVSSALAAALGGSAPRLTASGRGESEPVVSNTDRAGNDSPAGRARNRRVEIRIPKG